MRRIPTTMLLIPLGLTAAAAHADSVEFVVLSNTNGQQVSTPRSLYISLAQAGDISSNVSFSTDVSVSDEGSIEASSQDLSAVLYAMMSGPSNQAGVGFTTFDPALLPQGGGTDSPTGGESLIDELSTHAALPEIEPHAAPESQDDPKGGYTVDVPPPGAGALAASGLAGLAVRPRR